MSIEINNPELERMLREDIQSWHFNNVEELLTEALYALRERRGAVFPATAEATDSAIEPFWKSIIREVHALPDKVFEDLPTDGASEHDHYIYGTPKRNA